MSSADVLHLDPSLPSFGLAELPMGSVLNRMAMIACHTGNLAFPYSLAQRALLIADTIRKPEHRIYGLMWDAPATYIGEQQLGFRYWAALKGADITGLERRLLATIWQRLDLAAPAASVAIEIDAIAERVLATEWRDVVDDKSSDPMPTATPLTRSISYRHHDMVRDDLAAAFQNHLAIAHASGLRRAS